MPEPLTHDLIADPRATAVKSWINQSATMAGRAQRAEILDAFMGGRTPDRSPELATISQPLARAAAARHAVRLKSPIKSEALAHFFGGFAADKDSDVLSRLANGVKDLNYAKSVSPKVRNDFYTRLMYAGLIGAGSALAVRSLKKRPAEKTAAAMSDMDLRQLVRKLKLLRGTRGGSKLLRLLEARFASLEKAREAKK